MPKYKLHYFDVRGRGEIIRLVLTVAGQDFEDRRFSQEEWPKIKPEIPSGQVPLLEVDGKHMNESVAIARYLAREYGLVGKTNHEQYLMDRVLGTVEDLFMKAVQVYYEKDENKLADLQSTLDNEHFPRFLNLFTKYLEESGGDGDFFVGNSGTLADLAVHDVLTTFINKNDKVLDKYPKIQANRRATEALPNLSAYLAKRPPLFALLCTHSVSADRISKYRVSTPAFINMPKYKLHYFGVRGRGEIIRLVLTVAGQDFEDRRITQEEWPKVKAEIPSGVVPLLEVDGKQMNESVAIARYLAREYGLGGKTNHEQYLIDRVLGAVEDLFMKAVQILFLEKDEKKIADLQKALDNEHMPRFLKLFKKYLEESGGDGNFFVGNSGTLADLAVHDVLTTFLKKNDKLLNEYPTLQANRKATEALPHMSDYLAKRPDNAI